MSYYAATQTLNAGTGEIEHAGSVRKRGEPMLEVVKRVMRTPLGSYLPDPTFGIRMPPDKSVPGAAATFRESIYEAFRFYTQQGLMTELSAMIETDGMKLLYQIEFRDPRSGTKQKFKGTL
jgi:hypothetical protein